MTFQDDLVREAEHEAKLADMLWWTLSTVLAHDIDVTLPIEVKHDYKWHETGNVAVEVSCSWKPSGVSIGHWFIFYILWDDIYWASKKMVRNYLKEHHKSIRRCKGGDGMRVDMFLFPLVTFKELFKPFSDW